MTDLDRRCSALRLHEPHDAGERVALLVVPQAQAAGRDAAARLDMHDFGADNTGPAHGARAEVLQVPIVDCKVDAGTIVFSDPDTGKRLGT